MSLCYLLLGKVRTLSDVVEDLRRNDLSETKITLDEARGKNSGFEAYIALAEGEFKVASAYFKDFRMQGALVEMEWIKAVHYSALHQAREYQERLFDRGIMIKIEDKIYGNK